MKHTITSPRTNFIYTAGNPECKNHLYLFHGYAQTGEAFLKEFEYLKEDCFLVSIEGMSRFYAKGLFGEPANSWMTKYERASEIKDYMALIDRVYEEFSVGKTVQLLGFSQGSQTAARWFNKNVDKVNRLIMCGGLFPMDTKFEEYHQLKTTFIIGNDDSFLPLKSIEKHQKVYGKSHYDIFEGKHELSHGLIRKVINHN